MGSIHSKNIPKYDVLVAGNPSSCLLKIEKQTFRALLDSGADCSLIHYDVYKNLKHKPKLCRQNVVLNSVNGENLNVKGSIDLEFQIGKVKMTQMFFVVVKMNRRIILGRDWLKQRGVRVYYDLDCLRVDGCYVPLQEDIHITSVVRLQGKTKIAPQSSILCKAKVRRDSRFPSSGIFQVSSITEGFITKDPGLLVTNAVSRMFGNRCVSIMVVNSTNKMMTLRKGCPIAKIEQVNNMDIFEANQCNVKTPASETKIDFDTVDAPSQHKPRLIKLLKKNADLFAQTDSELSHTDTVKKKIDTGTSPPIKLRPYRTQLNNRHVINGAIDEMLDANIISKSKSPWSFAVVIVDKKDGTKRFCIDYRKLNKITKPNSYPLPVIDDILALLGNAKYFSSLDLKSGYWQVLMDDDDKEKTAFACHRGLYQFNVLPFGLCNAPAIFQEMMSTVLSGLDFAIAYLDDVLIWSNSLEEHLDHIQQVFDRLREHKLRLKLKKCGFLKEQTNYLGFVIDRTGIKADPKKVQVIKNLPSPTCVKDVRSFIGMSSYYRRFIPQFSVITEPLITLTKKNARFQWSTRCQEAFDCIKKHLTKIPSLGYPDITKPYIVYCDASDKCIGACLTQLVNGQTDVAVEKPIYFLSHKLSDTQTRWSVIEKECFAIHYALQKFDHYLHNAEFIIRTDHKPLKYILESPMQNKKIQLWALGIAGYNCKVEYVAGTDNSCADLLSRMPLNANDALDESDYEPDITDKTYQINALNSNRFNPRDYARCIVDNPVDTTKPQWGHVVDMVIEQENDELLMELKIGLQNDKLAPSVANRYLISDNIVYYISNADADPILRLYIPTQLRQAVINQYHDDNGHMGCDKTFDAIRQKYYWPNLYKTVHNHITACVPCQQRNMHRIKPLLQTTDIPPYAFAKVGLDLSGPYPTTLSGNKYIVSFIDFYSGYPEAFAVPDKCADTIAYLLINEIFPRYGCMLELVTDNGTENVNRVVRETLQALNIHHVTTSFYRPQGNRPLLHISLRISLMARLRRCMPNISDWLMLMSGKSPMMQQDGHYVQQIMLSYLLAIVPNHLIPSTDKIIHLCLG